MSSGGGCCLLLPRYVVKWLIVIVVWVGDRIITPEMHVEVNDVVLVKLRIHKKNLKRKS